MRKLEWIGLLLIAVSVYPLFLMGRELLAQRSAYNRYALKRVPTDVPGFSDDALSFMAGTHRIELRDDLFGQAGRPSDRAKGRVNVVVDGRDYSYASEVEIRPFFKDQNRYHSW